MEESPPKDGEPSTKTVKVKSWTWCNHHLVWRNHSPDGCRLVKKRREEQFMTNSADTSDTGATSASSAISLGLSYMATIASGAARDE